MTEAQDCPSSLGILWAFKTVKHRLSGHMPDRPDDAKHTIAEALDIRVWLTAARNGCLH